MEQLINFIIRPPRAEYNPKNDLLDQEFMLKSKWYQRKDMEVVNSRGDVLQCSHYLPIVPPEGKTLPCVIYCHGNSGCRTDASEAAIILLPSNITVFTLDFSGSGLSGGEYVTLGWNEKDDLRAVVAYLRADGNVSLIGLWGRSMGAVTSLMYGAEDPSIAGMVLDSPFSDLVDLMMELVETYKVRLPKFTVKFAIQYMRRAIQKKAKFDINDLNAIKVAKSCFVPVLFGHANDDDFIQPHHSDHIFDAYVGDKNIIKFEGDHNSPRPQFYFHSICIFFNNVLQPPEDEVGTAYLPLSHEYLGKGDWSTFHDLEDLHELSGSPSGPTASSSEDAIKQLRTRRPMSSIVVPTDTSSSDKHGTKVESNGSDSLPSSSNMISFDLSCSSPLASHLSASIDDEYVEYPLDTLSDFPSNVVEEERMFMEAILESLKTTPSHVEEPSANGAIDLPQSEPAPKNELLEDCFSEAREHKMESEMLQTNLNVLLLESSQKCTSLEEKTPGTCSSSETSAQNHHSPDMEIIHHPNHTLTITKSEMEEEASQVTSDIDLAGRTRVVLKVEKNPTNNIMDGLLRRWDLNFFRNK